MGASCRIHFYIWAKAPKIILPSSQQYRMCGYVLSPESVLFLRSIFGNISKSASFLFVCVCFAAYLSRYDLLCDLRENFTFSPESLLLTIAIILPPTGLFLWNFQYPSMQWIFTFTDISFSSFSGKHGCMGFLNTGFDIESPGIKANLLICVPKSPSKPPCVADSFLK